ncbi:MAG: cobyric acid synthase [Alphaproteobacteria bacterium]|nr:cobyric acid synthase [Alphaproteobacteria bacterium]MCA0450718.1 cobyric acid synthase [Pseudomonadota bacterium]
MPAKAIMFMGTGSDVGKSLIVAGLARAFANRGLRVAPFKPQNMSNNAAVTEDGGEIGRAQALQARAARIPASVHMNPVLLKPESDTGSQVVVQGKASGRATARDYHALKPKLLGAVRESFAILKRDADLVLVEGAGSPAEINLRSGDIANMGFAIPERVPVVLIADIERGGAIASIVGTLAVLEPDERAAIVGCLINKFRGDPSLFESGVAEIERRALPCLGVIPYFGRTRDLPPEDSVGLEQRHAGRAGTIKIRVPRLPRIANTDDLDPLAAEPDVDLAMLEQGDALPGDCDVVLLPGSKATLGDLAALRDNGWDIDIAAHHRRGGWVVGLCGGYQMLGSKIADPVGLEGPAQEAPGLGLLDATTVLAREKTLRRIDSRDAITGLPIAGYEIHLGETWSNEAPLLSLDGVSEGARSADGRVVGSYIHGLFASDRYRAAFLAQIRARTDSGLAYEARIDATLDALADHIAKAVDLDRLLELAR